MDQFVGGGTTLVEAKLLNRNIIGVDVNPAALERCREKCNFSCNHEGQVYIKQGDARTLSFIPNKSIDLICTHPPYANIIKYSSDIANDLSHYSIEKFLKEMSLVSSESFRVLKAHKYCAVLIGDIRKKAHVFPLGFHVMQIYLASGFSLKEIIVKEQHNCNSTNYWKEKSQKNNFLMLSHEFLFVFEKPIEKG